ncbi:MAG: hypothetical protein HUU16_15510 [Candidatus Omnitrophica bacterium]|nr:hypothetical protein [Candidatus Omnitrophota bacterium]
MKLEQHIEDPPSHGLYFNERHLYKKRAKLFFRGKASVGTFGHEIRVGNPRDFVAQMPRGSIWIARNWVGRHTC